MSCTNASWLDLSCPQYCTDPTTNLYGNMRQYADYKYWVLGEDSANCTNYFQVAIGYIDDNRDQILSAIIALPSVYTEAVLASAVATTVTEPASVTLTTTVTATATSSSSTQDTPASTIRRGVGVGVEIPLLLALLTSLFFL